LSLFAGLNVCGAQPAGPVLQLPGTTSEKTAATQVEIPLSDGTVLAASLWLPSSSSPVPVIVHRTPYDRLLFAGWSTLCTQRGIAFLAVDVRGRYASTGVWDPLVHEGADGQQVLAWVNAQSWCNGKIATQGGSYDAWDQLLTAAQGAPELDSMVLLVAPPDPFENIPFDNGGYYTPAFLWALQNRGRVLASLPNRDYLSVLASSPIASWDDLVGLPTSWLDQWLAHWQLDEYWQQRSYEHGLVNVTAPSLLVTGWFDRDQPGCIRTFQALSRHPDEEVQGSNKLILGPWMHDLEYKAQYGELSFPPNAERNVVSLMLDWQEVHLLGDGQRDGAPVEYYLMGRDVWLEASQWPPEQTQPLCLYLHPSLELRATASQAGSTTFVYDPSDPTPAAIVDEQLWSLALGHIPLDVFTVSQRQDTLLFLTAPLEQALGVAGPVSVELYVSSSAEDTDFAAQLVDLTPDGRAISLQQGLTRTRFRQGYTEPRPLPPGVVSMVELDLWSLAYEFSAGHRIGLLISSALFPAFAPHRNLFDDLASGTDWELATQTIHCGQACPSRLVLPVLSEPRRIRSRRNP